MEVNNEYQVVWSPSLTEIRAVVVFVEFLMRNRELQFIHLKHWRILLKLDLLGTSYAVVKHYYVYALNVVTGYLVCFEFVFRAFDLFFRDFRKIFS